MPAIIRRASIYVKTKKVAELESSEITQNSNSEQMHGAEGILGATVGNPEVEIRGNYIRSLKIGEALEAIENAILTGEPILMSYQYGNKQLYAYFVITVVGLSSDARTGTLKGNFTARNAENPTTA